MDPAHAFGNKMCPSGNNTPPSLPLPQTPESDKESRIWDEEKDDDDELGDAAVEGQPPITYEFLTFDTQLLHPPHVPTGRGTGSPPPKAPDLTKYTSPFLWPEQRKRLIVWLSCSATSLTALSAGAYSPGSAQMQREWGVSKEATLCGITMFTSGFAIAPMVLAPFSEINGRRPVFIATGILFVVCQLCCAVSQSFAGLLAARFFVGVGGSTFSTMVGGVVSDIYHTEQRNTPMTLFTAGAMFGTGMGPFLTGFIAEHISWRWMFYVQTILDGVLILVVIVFFKETRGSVLLSRKARALNQWYHEREKAGYYGVPIPSRKDPGTHEMRRVRWRVKSDEERASLAKMIGISCYRPFHLLLTEPVVFWFSCWVSFSWVVLYMTFAAVPLVFSTTYGFNVQQQGYVFSSISVAAALFTPVCIYQEKWAKSRNKLPDAPEARLYFSCYQSVLLPLGLFMFGWTARSSTHWIAPTIAIGLATTGIFSIYLAVFNYLADTYHRYASSALAAQSFCRNILGGVFPLFTTQMFAALTYGGAGSFLGGLGILLTIVPWVLMLYGPRIRARSRFASEIIK